jgi:serine/threonine protein kinase
MANDDSLRAEAERLCREIRDLPTQGKAERLRALCRDNETLHSKVASLLLRNDPPLAADDDGRHASTMDVREERGAGGDRGRHIGETTGPYCIIRELGRGGMGVVYLAERADRDVQKFAAVKVLKRGLDTEAFLRRFQQERQILSAIRHPGVAAFLDAGETSDGRPYYVMEYVDGQPITSYCDMHRLDVEERLRLFQDVCAAVQCVNSHLIVHRDLKPSNVLVMEGGHAKLLDFGIAKFLNPDLSHAAGPPTGPESRVMTPEYASPEQVRGRPLTTASDVYSLGVILYEILSGHPPYRLGQKSHHEVLEAVCERDPDAPSTVSTRTEESSPEAGVLQSITPATVSRDRQTQPDQLRRRLQGDLDSIVLQALRKEPQRRYQSAADLAADIGNYLAGRPVLASADTLVYRFSKFVRRNKLGVAAAVFIGLSLLIGLSGTGYGLARATDARDRANLHVQKLVDIALAYVDDLDDAVEELDGSLPLREEFAATAVRLLEDATASLAAHEDRGAILTLARAHRRLGEVSGSRRNPNKGDADQAMDWYERSRQGIEELLEWEPDDPEAMRELALTLLAQADLLDERKEYEEARRLGARAHSVLRVLNEANGDRQTRADLAASLVALGRDARRQGERDRSEEHFRAALQLRLGLAMERPDDEAAQRALSVVLLRLGNVRREAGDFAEAQRRYGEALRIRQDLAEREPGNARYRRDLITAAYLTASLLKDLGDPDAAVAHLEPTMAIREESYRRNPSDARAKGDLAMGHVLMGLLRVEQERWDEAELSLRAGHVLSAQLLDLDSRNGNYQSLVAGSRIGLATVSLARGNASEAKAEILVVLPIDGRTPEALAVLARAQFTLGEVDGAHAIAIEGLAKLESRTDRAAEALRRTLHEVTGREAEHE